MTAHDQMAFKYITGLIVNRGIGKQFWLDPTRLNNPIARAMVSELKDLWAANTAMTPEIIMDRFLKNRTVTEFMEPDAILEWVRQAVQQEVPRTEIHDLYEQLQRDYIFNHAKSTLESLLDRMDTREALERAQAVFRDLQTLMPGPTVNLEQQMLEAYEEAAQGAKGIIPFGIPIMDAHLGGFSRGEVSIIAGRPGHGKTSFALQLAANYLDQGLKVLIISKEMKTFRILHKLIANKTELTSRKLHRGDLTDEEKAQLREWIKDLVAKYDGRFFIYDDVYDVQKIETMIAKHKPDVVIDDFIQLTACDDSNMRLEILRIMKTYKQFAKEYNAAVITLSQLNRSIETRDDPVPRLSDLAESGAIEQLAADVVFIYYPHKIDPQKPMDQVLVIASKTRYGTTGRFMLQFDGQHMRFRQIPMVVR